MQRQNFGLTVCNSSGYFGKSLILVLLYSRCASDGTPMQALTINFSLTLLMILVTISASSGKCATACVQNRTLLPHYKRLLHKTWSDDILLALSTLGLIKNGCLLLDKKLLLIHYFQLSQFIHIWM